MAKELVTGVDFIGNTLNLGDIVVLTGAGKSNLHFGKIIGFTAKGVKVVEINQKTHQRLYTSRQYLNRTNSQIALLSKAANMDTRDLKDLPNDYITALL
jgi:hypothetical protein